MILKIWAAVVGDAIIACAIVVYASMIWPVEPTYRPAITQIQDEEEPNPVDDFDFSKGDIVLDNKSCNFLPCYRPQK